MRRLDLHFFAELLQISLVHAAIVKLLRSFASASMQAVALCMNAPCEPTPVHRKKQGVFSKHRNLLDMTHQAISLPRDLE